MQTWTDLALLELVAGPGTWRLEMYDALGFEVPVGHRYFLLELDRKYWLRRKARRTAEVKATRARQKRQTKEFSANQTKTNVHDYQHAQALLAQVIEEFGGETDLSTVAPHDLGVLLSVSQLTAAAELEDEQREVRREARAAKKAARLQEAVQKEAALARGAAPRDPAEQVKKRKRSKLTRASEKGHSKASARKRGRAAASAIVKAGATGTAQAAGAAGGASVAAAAVPAAETAAAHAAAGSLRYGQRASAARARAVTSQALRSESLVDSAGESDPASEYDSESESGSGSEPDDAGSDFDVY